jgi:hypothetical protein
MKIFLITMLLMGQAYAQHSHHGSAHSSEVKRKSLNENDKKLVLEVLEKNDVLFNAFLKKDAKQVEKSALDLNLIMSKSTSTVLSSVKKHASKLSGIKSTNSNESNLSLYEQFLNPLIEIVKINEVGNKFNVFNCPMVKKSWIQNIEVNKDVKNVYAMDMLECGAQETHF